MRMSALEIAENWEQPARPRSEAHSSAHRGTPRAPPCSLDGVDGSFSLSDGPIDIGTALNWTWSSRLAMHVTVDEERSSQAGHATTRRCSGSNVIRSRGTWKRFSSIVTKQVEPAVDVVQHIVGCFRSHRQAQGLRP